MDLRSFMNDFGGAENFTINRNDVPVGIFEGLRNSSKGKRFIQFFPDADVRPGDWIFAEASNENFYVDDVATSMGFGKEMFSKNAFYLTESQYEKESKRTSPITFQIGDVKNSIIGTQQNATLTNNFSDNQIKEYIDQNCGADKELMNEMLAMVNTMIEHNIPVQKGSFARFSEAASKHGWLLGAVTTKLLTHFFK